MNKQKRTRGWKKEYETFALMLHKRLEERKIKSSVLAKILGVHEGTVYRWLRAEVLPSDRDIVFRIADFLRFEADLRQRFLLAYLNELPEEIIATETTQIYLLEPPGLKISSQYTGFIPAHELTPEQNRAGLGVKVNANELITASMSILNREPTTVTILKLVAAVRGPHAFEKNWDAEVGDFGTDENIKIKPDEVYEYRHENIFYKPGDYVVIPLFFKPDGGWQEIRPRRRLHFII
jgi:transcriptional regulator with XRE-family HTH domain